MAFFTPNSNQYLNSNSSILFNDYEESNRWPETEQKIYYEIENTLISKKSNNTKYQKTFEQSETQNKNEIEIFHNLPPKKNDPAVSTNIRNIIQDEDELLNINLEDNNISKFLSGKRKETHQNNFYVFTPSDNDNDLRELINKTINDLKNNNKKIYTEMEELDSPKKQHKKKKNICRRKHNSDIITKKIKSRFLKSLKNNSNKILKSIKSTELFKYLPKEFVCNMTKRFNCYFFDKTYKEILSKNFNCVGNGKNSSLKQIEHNKSVLKYLEDNKKINDLYFLNMTYIELFNEYFKSKEFENEINNLKEKDKEKLSYIKNYIIKTYNFIKFFSK